MLDSAASSRYPSGGGIGAIIGPCIEGNRRAWGSLTNSVDDDFESLVSGKVLCRI
jgi:hypothetical protein